MQMIYFCHPFSGPRIYQSTFYNTGAEVGMFHENYVNTIAADALAPYVARSSTAMALIIYNEQTLVFTYINFPW